MRKQSLGILVVALLIALAFLVAPVAADKYVVTSSSGSPAAGSAVTITAQLSTDADVAISTAGKVVSWSKTGTGGSFSEATSTTGSNGIATVTLTTGTTAGTVYTVTATDGDSITGTSAAVTTVAGTATQMAANSVTTQSATPGTAVTAPPSVIVKDTNNNPVSGVNVAFAVTAGGGTPASTSVTTNSAGIATMSSWTLGSAAGPNTLIATSGSLTGSPITFSATGTSSTPAPTISSITPASGYNTSTLGTTTLAGTGFSTSTVPTVVLRRSGSTNITATGVSATATSITCTFDIINKQSGTWDLIVTNPDGQYALLTNGFQIVSSSGQVTLSSITPATSITNKTVSITSLAGTNFAGTPQVYLKKSTYNSIYGTFTTSSSTLLTGTFNLTNVVPTTYEVCVKNSGADAVCGLSFIVSPMQQTNGSIYFTSSPSGSSVFVDTVSKGTTPFTLYNLTPGTYSIRMQKSEYLDWADRVTVTSGNETKVNGVLSYQNSATTATTEPTVVITTATLPPTTVKSTKTIPTPWADSTATPASPVDVLVVVSAVGLGIVLLRRQ